MTNDLLDGDDDAIVGENIRTLKSRGLSEEQATLVSLKRTKKEKSEGDSVCCAPGGGDDYPYGTRLDLDEDSLDKLGITNLPEVGSTMKVTAEASVDSVSSRAYAGEDGGKQKRSLTLQLTKMALA